MRHVDERIICVHVIMGPKASSLGIRYSFNIFIFVHAFSFSFHHFQNTPIINFYSIDSPFFGTHNMIEFGCIRNVLLFTFLYLIVTNLDIGGSIMSNTSRSKLKLLYLMKLLLERTDSENIVTMKDLLYYLSTHGIEAERKSIYSDISLLCQFGLNIETRKLKTFGYYICDRTFEFVELKLLVDAVQSSRCITAKKSLELIKKLASLTSVSQAAQLERQVLVSDRPKPQNEKIYYNIDAIHTAINSGHKIRFKYFDYDVKKSVVYRKNNEFYNQTPVSLCWSDDKYYLICYSEKYDDFANYRVDRMSNVEVCPEKVDKFDKNRFNSAEYSKRIFGMFNGDVVTTTLRFDKSLVNNVLDKFGADTPLPIRDDKFEIRVKVSNSPVFLAWMFQFGKKAEIVSPESLKHSMISLLKENSQAYM